MVEFDLNTGLRDWKICLFLYYYYCYYYYHHHHTVVYEESISGAKQVSDPRSWMSPLPMYRHLCLQNKYFTDSHPKDVSVQTNELLNK